MANVPAEFVPAEKGSSFDQLFVDRSAQERRHEHNGEVSAQERLTVADLKFPRFV